MIYIGQCLLYYVGAQYLLSVFTEPDYLPWFTLVNAYFTIYLGAQYFIKCIHWTRLSTLIYIGQCLLYYVGAQYLLSVFTEPDYLPWFTLVNALLCRGTIFISVFTEPIIYNDLSTLIYIGQCLLPFYYVGAQYLLSVFTEPDYLPWFTLVNAYFTM